jgi:TRAP-type transport system periplasmic protein
MSALKRLSLAATAAGLLLAPTSGPATFATTVAAQAAINIKLATQAPVNSSWHKALLDMGAEWTAKTGGRVKLTVYPGGSQGSEDATIRMMRPGVDQLQANLLTVTGLAQIDDAFNVFGVPFFFENDAENQFVQQKLSAMLEKRLQAKGFQQLSWANVGWVQLFSKKPIATLAEVKSAKLFTSQGDDKMVQWYKNNGFNAVALSATDIPAQLKLPNGMIDAAPSPPYAALVLQMFRDAKYMLDVRVAPLVGALVITNEAWNKIGAADRPAMIAAAKAFEARISAEAPKQDADSVATMKTRGLTVTALDAKAAAAFRTEAEKLAVTMRGSIVPADIYDLARQERDAFRKTKGK